jgi:sugar O-acyltransferase (sialic acid O-acetyltransferase NeuD family)
VSGQRVLVVGGSDQGRQAIDVLDAAARDEIVGILDRRLPVGTEVGGIRVLGRDDEVAACAAAVGATAFVVAIGDNASRRAVTRAVLEACPRLGLVSAIHPSAVISRRAVVQPGAIVMAGTVVSNGCTVGMGALLGTKASIDHDCVLDEFVSLAPGATTGGGVRIGACTALGIGANVINGVTIGAHTVIGAGAAVVGDVVDHVVAVGVPARVARRRGEGEPYLTRG